MCAGPGSNNCTQCRPGYNLEANAENNSPNNNEETNATTIGYCIYNHNNEEGNRTNNENGENDSSGTSAGTVILIALLGTSGAAGLAWLGFKYMRPGASSNVGGGTESLLGAEMSDKINVPENQYRLSENRPVENEFL